MSRARSAQAVKIVVTDEYVSSLIKLPSRTLSKALRLTLKVEENPFQPGLNYEKLHANDNLFSLRIDDAYRVIITREDTTGTFVFLWADHHDEAYRWANRRRCAINQSTGVLQVYTVQNMCDFEVLPSGDSTSWHVPNEPLVADSSTIPLFSTVKDVELAALGVPDSLMSLVRSITTEDGLRQVKDMLPADAYENLTWLEGGLTVDDVLVYLGLERGDDGDIVKAPIPATFAEAFERGSATCNFHVVESDEDLLRIFEAPLEKWRVFLHPSQRKLVERTFNGPARVLGGAGTGKTVVAMHRARRLALRLLGTADRVLFTTFTTNLVENINENMRSICSDEELGHIEVINLNKWASGYLVDHGRPFAFEFEDEVLLGMWETALKKTGLDDVFEPQFVKNEWEQVIVPREAFTFASYARAPRAGMGKQLHRAERSKIWQVVEQYRAICQERGVRDADYAYSGVRDMVLADTRFVPYRHVVVDEAQDFSPSAFRLLRALAGEERPDDLFIVGDAHQRIYGKRVTLSACGVNIRGRGSKLRVNYRTTEETRRAAEALLAGADYDDLDGGSDPLDGTQSLTHGEAPVFERAGNEADEATWIIKQVNELVGEGVPTKDICVVFPFKSQIERFERCCTEKGCPTVRLVSNQSDDRSVDGLRVATMHRVKGLEFEHMFVAGVNDGAMPSSRRLEQARRNGTEDALMQGERSLLYVAMTRARRRTFVSCSGKPSSLLTGLDK